MAGIAGCFGTLPGDESDGHGNERLGSSPDRETTGRGSTTRISRNTTAGETTRTTTDGAAGRARSTPTRTPPDCGTLLPRPDRETDEGLEPVSYPDFPGTLTEDAAAAFAVAATRPYTWWYRVSTDRIAGTQTGFDADAATPPDDPPYFDDPELVYCR